MSAVAALLKRGVHFVPEADTHPLLKGWQTWAEISPPPTIWTVRHDG